MSRPGGPGSSAPLTRPSGRCQAVSTALMVPNSSEGPSAGSVGVCTPSCTPSCTCAVQLRACVAWTCSTGRCCLPCGAPCHSLRVLQRQAARISKQVTETAVRGKASKGLLAHPDTCVSSEPWSARRLRGLLLHPPLALLLSSSLRPVCVHRQAEGRESHLGVVGALVCTPAARLALAPAPGLAPVAVVPVVRGWVVVVLLPIVVLRRQPAMSSREVRRARMTAKLVSIERAARPSHQ